MSTSDALSSATAAASAPAPLPAPRRVSDRAEIARVQRYLRTQLPEALKLWSTINSWQQQTTHSEADLIEPLNPTLYISCSSVAAASVPASGEDDFADLDAVVLVYGPANTPEQLAIKRAHTAQLRAAQAAAPTNPRPPRPIRSAQDVYVMYHARPGSEQLLSHTLRATIPHDVTFLCTGVAARWTEAVMAPLAREFGAVWGVNAHHQWQRFAPGQPHPAPEPLLSPLPTADSTAPPTSSAHETVPPRSDTAAWAAAADSISMSPPPAPASPASSPSTAAAAVSSSNSAASSDVIIAPLRAEHAEMIARLWPYTSAGTPRVLAHLIAHLPQQAVYVDGEPVCWALQQTYGGIGMLHTLESHRGRGYARRCIDALCAQLFAKGAEPFCFIGTVNDASQATFRRLGFEPLHKVEWLTWQPDVYDEAPPSNPPR